jgi:UDP-2,4-diacetamido-2,4,6-trideoxy-beta-L-altropyranose hydrolase
LKPRIIIRCDGGKSIGMGHVVRCLALADMLKNYFSIHIAIQKPPQTVINTIQTATKNIIILPETSDFEKDKNNFIKHILVTDIVVLDGYEFKTQYQQQIKNKGCKLVCIDDLHNWHQVADVIINHAVDISPLMYSAEKYTKFYLGLDYVLLRAPFLNTNQETRRIVNIHKIFISMGAADADNNTLKFAKALIILEKITEVHLMLSSINPHLESILDLISNNPKQNIFTHFNISAEELKEILLHSDLAICPASSISLECCAIGIPILSGYSAENQRSNLAGMEKHKTLINFESFDKLSVSEIAYKIEKLITDSAIFSELVQNQKKMIDGKSPERLVELFKKLSCNK